MLLKKFQLKKEQVNVHHEKWNEVRVAYNTIRIIELALQSSDEQRIVPKDMAKFKGFILLIGSLLMFQGFLC
jgi:hypothetical protein